MKRYLPAIFITALQALLLPLILSTDRAYAVANPQVAIPVFALFAVIWLCGLIYAIRILTLCKTDKLNPLTLCRVYLVIRVMSFIPCIFSSGLWLGVLLLANFSVFIPIIIYGIVVAKCSYRKKFMSSLAFSTYITFQFIPLLDFLSAMILFFRIKERMRACDRESHADVHDENLRQDCLPITKIDNAACSDEKIDSMADKQEIIEIKKKGSIKQYLPTLFIIACPYAIFLAIGFSSQSSSYGSLSRLWFLIPAVLWLIGVIYGIRFFFHCGDEKWDSVTLSLMNMVIKLTAMPFFIIVFFVTTLLSGFLLFFAGIFWLIVWLVDVLIIALNGIFGATAVRRNYMEKRISFPMAILLGALQFVFCLDVISAIILFINAKIQKNEERRILKNGKQTLRA